MVEQAQSSEKLEGLVVEYRMLQGLSADLQQRINTLSSLLSELQAASSTIEEVEKVGEGAEVLIPIGGASYLKARLAHGGRVVVGLGAGVAVDKSLEDAKKYLEKRMEELSQALSTVQSQLVSVATRMAQLEPKIREALEKESKKAG